MNKYDVERKQLLRVIQVEQWLSDNVQVFKNAKTVTLSNFELTPPGYRGAFVVSLDDVPIDSKFDFVLGDNGYPVLNVPIFHSPLGVPASYAAVELGENITFVIKKMLKDHLPRMKALGYHRETDEYVYATNDSNRIISPDEYEAKMTKLLELNFSISANVPLAPI